MLVAQSCPTLCNPMDCSLPGSSVHGILQGRILGWVAIPFSRDLPDPGIEPGLHFSDGSDGKAISSIFHVKLGCHLTLGLDYLLIHH